MQPHYMNFEKAIRSLGFDKKKLELEYLLSGANNYVIGLKHNELTWALSISFPKTSNITNVKLQKFVRLQEVCSYLTKMFKEGVDIDRNTKFLFDGNCYLCEPNSTKECLKRLANKKSLKISNLLDKYTGPFLVKKGAPASETLEYDIDFKTVMLQGLSILHKHTGVIKLVDKELVIQITKQLIRELDKKIPSMKMSSELRREIEIYNQKWNKDRNQRIQAHIIREIVIRSEKSFSQLVDSCIQRHKINLVAHKCFIHGDAHGGNFIIVQKGRKKEVHPIDVEEALGLDESEKQHYLFDLIKFTISAYNLSRIFKKPLAVDALIDIYYGHFDFLNI